MTKKCLATLTTGIVLIGLAWGQNSGTPKPADNDNETLRQYADKLGFGVGVFIQPRYWKRDPEHNQIMGREFNRAVSYAVIIQKERAHYDFDLMDQEMKFAKEHNMKRFGAGLIYRTTAAPE